MFPNSTIYKQENGHLLAREESEIQTTTFFLNLTTHHKGKEKASRQLHSDLPFKNGPRKRDLDKPESPTDPESKMKQEHPQYKSYDQQKVQQQQRNQTRNTQPHHIMLCRDGLQILLKSQRRQDNTNPHKNTLD